MGLVFGSNASTLISSSSDIVSWSWQCPTCNNIFFDLRAIHGHTSLTDHYDPDLAFEEYIRARRLSLDVNQDLPMLQSISHDNQRSNLTLKKYFICPFCKACLTRTDDSNPHPSHAIYECTKCNTDFDIKFRIHGSIYQKYLERLGLKESEDREKLAVEEYLK